MRIALIAHDETKPDLVEFARERRDLLERVDLVATGSTGDRVAEATGLAVERVNSGPDGGDLMIGAAVADGTCDAVVFLRDPKTAQPHEPDITALSRICDVRNVPLATNRATADLVATGIAARADGDGNERHEHREDPGGGSDR